MGLEKNSLNAASQNAASQNAPSFYNQGPARENGWQAAPVREGSWDGNDRPKTTEESRHSVTGELRKLTCIVASAVKRDPNQANKGLLEEQERLEEQIGKIMAKGNGFDAAGEDAASINNNEESVSNTSHTGAPTHTFTPPALSH